MRNFGFMETAAAEASRPGINSQPGEPNNYNTTQSEQLLPLLITEQPNNDNHNRQMQSEQPPLAENQVDAEVAGHSTETELAAAGGGEGNPDQCDPYIGMTFDSQESAKKYYSEYAMRLGFRARSFRTKTSVDDGSVIMLRMVCYKQGVKSKKARNSKGGKERKMRVVKEDCKAVFQVIWKGRDKWVVSRLVLEHTHPLLADEALKYKRKRMETFVPVSAGMGGEQKQLGPHVGMVFYSLESAKQFYLEYAQCNGFRTRSGKMRISELDGSIIMQRFMCCSERIHFKEADKGKNGNVRRTRAPISGSCKAMIEVVRRFRDQWVISKFVMEHTHALVSLTEEHVSEVEGVAVAPVDTRSLFGDSSGELNTEIKHDCTWTEGKIFGLLEYLKMKQAENPLFFYSVRVDENESVANIFWADAKARMAYNYFSDVITLDTTYKKNKNMVPFVLFTGKNNHVQPVVFGCALLWDETETSLVWLFDTFLVAMCGRHPALLITGQSEALRVAVAKVFPHTHHRFCKWQILSKCKEELSDMYAVPATWRAFKGELKKCIIESETVEGFESGWDVILFKYKLRENMWLQSLYEVRQLWAPVYLKDTFFAEVSPTQRSESMNKFFRRNFGTKTTLLEFVRKFDQAMLGQHEKEIQADFASTYMAPVLKTASPIEKQAAKTYTRTIFAIFQEELVQAIHYYYYYSAFKVEDGIVCKYLVNFKGEDARKTYMVSFNSSEKRAGCSCSKFEFSGILCRHALRVFSEFGIRKLPKDYFLKRWMQNARTGAMLYESSTKVQSDCQSASTLRCNDLCLDVLKYAAEGATSSVIHKVAKDALQKAFFEVVAAKKSVRSIEPGM